MKFEVGSVPDDHVPHNNPYHHAGARACLLCVQQAVEREDRADVRSVAPAGRHQVRKSTRRVHLLLPDHDINRGQHYPNAGSLFVAVIARNEQTVRRAK
jgi:hypothetical protein